MEACDRTDGRRTVRAGVRAAAICGVAIASAVGWMLYEAQWVQRVDRRFAVDDVASGFDGLVIAHLSDFHAGFTPSFNLRAARKAVDLALAASPDLVVLTGDFFGGDYGVAELQRQLRRLAAVPLGAFAVLGNHDYGLSKAPSVTACDPSWLTACGVRLLVNEAVTLECDAGMLQIVGVDKDAGGPRARAAALDAFDRIPGALRLLLSHYGDVVAFTEPGDAHLTFAGDTHGGQLCLPLPGGRVMLSDLHALHPAGLYDCDGRALHVTRGVGTSLLPFRLFCRPEVAVFRLEVGAG